MRTPGRIVGAVLFGAALLGLGFTAGRWTGPRPSPPAVPDAARGGSGAMLRLVPAWMALAQADGPGSSGPVGLSGVDAVVAQAAVAQYVAPLVPPATLHRLEQRVKAQWTTRLGGPAGLRRWQATYGVSAYQWHQWVRGAAAEQWMQAQGPARDPRPALYTVAQLRAFYQAHPLDFQIGAHEASFAAVQGAIPYVMIATARAQTGEALWIHALAQAVLGAVAHTVAPGAR